MGLYADISFILKLFSGHFFNAFLDRAVLSAVL